MQEKVIQITVKKVSGRRNSVQGRAKSSNRAKLIKNPQDKVKKMEFCTCLKKMQKKKNQNKKRLIFEIKNQTNYYNVQDTVPH